MANAVFQNAIDIFMQHLRLERGLSQNSLAAYRTDLRELAARFKDCVPGSITPSDITRFFGELVQKGRKPTTLARKLSSVKHFFDYLIETELSAGMKDNPAKAYRAPRIARYHPDYLSAEEVGRIIDAAGRNVRQPERNRAIIELLYGCGLRISELISLKVANIEFEAGFVKVTGKGNKQRLVPIGGPAKEAVEKYLEVSDGPLRTAANGYLVLSHSGRTFSRVGLWKIVRKAIVGAGILKVVTPHSFRHSFATHLLMGGADLRTVQEMLGHADISTTEIYTRIDRDYIVAEHRKHHPRELAGFQRSGDED